VTTLFPGVENPDDRRDLVWAEAWDMMVSKSVGGHGPGSFQRAPIGTSSPIADYYRLHAHNVLLHVGAESGLFGLLGVVG
jgi:O-antigen ligase